MSDTIAARLAVMDVIIRYATSVDARDMEQYATCFTQDLHVVGYGAAAISGRGAYVAYVQEALKRFGRTQHLLSNHVIDVQGDTATMRTYLQAIHVLADDPSKLLILWAIYHDTLVRQNDVWCIFAHRLEPIAREIGTRVTSPS